MERPLNQPDPQSSPASPSSQDDALLQFLDAAAQTFSSPQEASGPVPSAAALERMAGQTGPTLSMALAELATREQNAITSASLDAIALATLPQSAASPLQLTRANTQAAGAISRQPARRFAHTFVGRASQLGGGLLGIAAMVLVTMSIWPSTTPTGTDAVVPRGSEQAQVSEATSLDVGLSLAAAFDESLDLAALGTLAADAEALSGTFSNEAATPESFGS